MARVVIAPKSDPASGSVIQKQPIFSPRIAGKKYSSRISSVPWWNRKLVPIKHCMAVMEAALTSPRAISSQIMQYKVVLPPAPPLLRG